MNTSLCSRYARYSSRGGCGRAPSSNSTGVSRSAAIARETACRSAASSPSVELTNTRRRWSGVRMAMSPPEEGHTSAWMISRQPIELGRPRLVPGTRRGLAGTRRACSLERPAAESSEQPRPLGCRYPESRTLLRGEVLSADYPARQVPPCVRRDARDQRLARREHLLRRPRRAPHRDHHPALT